MPSSHLILCPPLLLLAPIPPSVRVFSNESVLCIRWPEYWSFNIIPSNSGLTSFKIDWFDLFAVQRTLKTLFPTSQFKSINSSALSFLYGPTLTPICDTGLNCSFIFEGSLFRVQNSRLVDFCLSTLQIFHSTLSFSAWFLKRSLM